MEKNSTDFVAELSTLAFVDIWNWKGIGGEGWTSVGDMWRRVGCVGARCARIGLCLKRSFANPDSCSRRTISQWGFLIRAWRGSDGIIQGREHATRVNFLCPGSVELRKDRENDKPAEIKPV